MTRFLPHALLALLAAPAAHAAGALIIASEQPAFAEAARRAKEVLGGDGEIVSPGDVAKASAKQPKVVVAIGPLAERVAAGAMPPDARAVACLTPRLSQLTAGRTTVVSLLPTDDETVETIRAALPSVKSIGVLAAKSGSLGRAAQAKGFVVLDQKPGESFDAAVDRLLRESDALWVQDAASLPGGAQGMGLVLRRALDKRRPVIGPNRAAVSEGALFAIVPDPGEQGRVAGELAEAVLAGQTPPPTASAPGRLVFNERVEKALGVRIPDDVKRAGEAIR